MALSIGGQELRLGCPGAAEAKVLWRTIPMLSVFPEKDAKPHAIFWTIVFPSICTVSCRDAI
jgi:hypothetical protein